MSCSTHCGKQLRLGTEQLRLHMQCHRLDAETGGLVLVAKTRPALKAMTYAFTHREIKKRYHGMPCVMPLDPEFCNPLLVQAY
jgi:23S rRNA-/tRNA-specific pseudouridylate synthase